MPLHSRRVASAPGPHPRTTTCKLPFGSDTPSDSDGGLGRFREFTSREGDHAVQDTLEREVLRQVTRTATTHTLETTIQDELKAVSDNLADMYSRSDRDRQSRHEELARRASLANISKWNQQLIQGAKMSKSNRSEISKELAVVQVMLRRNRRGRGKRRRRSATVAQRRRDGDVGYALDEEAVKQASKPIRLLFTVMVCVNALRGFEHVAVQESGPTQLAKGAAAFSLVLLTGACLRSIGEAARKKQDS